MTDKERARSYEYYKQWQVNRGRYRAECVAYTFMFGIGLFLVLSNWKSVVLGIGLALIFVAIYLLIKIGRKWYKKHRALIELRNMAQELGARDIKVDSENGRISFVVPEDSANEELSKMSESLSQKGLKLKVTKSTSDNTEDFSKAINSTDTGFINKNNQRNNGKTNQQGTDYNQFFYEMECLNCGHIYHANGSDIWLRKCPSCQGGKP
jgi:flagellar biogenesis protein FliO